MAYAVLTENLKPDALERMDEMLSEPYLTDFPEGFERDREAARRFAREKGIGGSEGLQQAFGLPRAGGPVHLA